MVHVKIYEYSIMLSQSNFEGLDGYWEPYEGREDLVVFRYYNDERNPHYYVNIPHEYDDREGWIEIRKDQIEEYPFEELQRLRMELGYVPKKPIRPKPTQMGGRKNRKNRNSRNSRKNKNRKNRATRRR